MSNIDKRILNISSEQEYKELRSNNRNIYWEADVIIVAGMIKKNRFGYADIPYEGHFGICGCCNSEIKVRSLFLENFIGCMC